MRHTIAEPLRRPIYGSSRTACRLQMTEAAQLAAQGRSLPLWSAVLRGLRRRCPACGTGRSFRAYLKLRQQCDVCGESLGHFRADDIPPYATIFLVGHMVVPLVLWTERHHAPPIAAQMIGWPLLTGLLTLLLLPFVKGGVVGLMWRLGLRGDERQ